MEYFKIWNFITIILVTTSALEEVCKKDLVQISIVLDATFAYCSSYKSTPSFLTTLAQQSDSILNTIKEEFPDSQFAVAFFTDWNTTENGNNGKWQKKKSYCYHKVQNLTTDFVKVQNAFKYDACRYGGYDESDSSLNAVLYTAMDPSIGWIKETVHNGQRVRKIIVLVTDKAWKTMDAIDHRFPEFKYPSPQGDGSDTCANGPAKSKFVFDLLNKDNFYFATLVPKVAMDTFEGYKMSLDGVFPSDKWEIEELQPEAAIQFPHKLLRVFGKLFCDPCPTVVEIALVIDSTMTFTNPYGGNHFIKQMQDGIMAYLEGLEKQNEIMFSRHKIELKFGLTSFGDYPTKKLQNMGKSQCYKFHHRLTERAGKSLNVWANNVKQTYGGIDEPESSLNALLYTATDPHMGWSQGKITADGKRVAKIIFVATDMPWKFQEEPGDGEEYFYPPPKGDGTDDCTKGVPSAKFVFNILREKEFFVVPIIAKYKSAKQWQGYFNNSVLLSDIDYRVFHLKTQTVSYIPKLLYNVIRMTCDGTSFPKAQLRRRSLSKNFVRHISVANITDISNSEITFSNSTPMITPDELISSTIAPPPIVVISEKANPPTTNLNSITNISLSTTINATEKQPKAKSHPRTEKPVETERTPRTDYKTQQSLAVIKNSNITKVTSNRESQKLKVPPRESSNNTTVLNTELSSSNSTSTDIASEETKPLTSNIIEPITATKISSSTTTTGINATSTNNAVSIQEPKQAVVSSSVTSSNSSTVVTNKTSLSIIATGVSSKSDILTTTTKPNSEINTAINNNTSTNSIMSINVIKNSSSTSIVSTNSPGTNNTKRENPSNDVKTKKIETSKLSVSASQNGIPTEQSEHLKSKVTHHNGTITTTSSSKVMDLKSTANKTKIEKKSGTMSSPPHTTPTSQPTVTPLSSTKTKLTETEKQKKSETKFVNHTKDESKTAIIAPTATNSSATNTMSDNKTLLKEFQEPTLSMSPVNRTVAQLSPEANPSDTVTAEISIGTPDKKPEIIHTNITLSKYPSTKTTNTVPGKDDIFEGSADGQGIVGKWQTETEGTSPLIPPE